MRYSATIYYTIDEDHTDIEYLNDWSENKEYQFSDTYTFDEQIYTKDDQDTIIRYIKADLKLIAGGGYNSEHIHNVKFKIVRL